MTDPILEIKQLTIRFGVSEAIAPVISQLDLSIHAGQCLGLVGESGSGKSMTALAMMQLLPGTAYVDGRSQILLEGRNILDYSEQQMRRIRGPRIGMIFQDAMSAFNPVFTIGQQLLEIGHQRLSKTTATQNAYALLEEVGIADPERTFRSYPHQLSGGMRQRAMIAMALSGKPDLLIADEPTTALDVTIQAQVLNLLKSLQETRKTSLLFIGHDLAVVSQLADNIIVMKKGKKIEEADAASFFQNPQEEYSKQLLAAIPPDTIRQDKAQPEKPLLNVAHLKVHFPIRKGILKRTVGYIKAVDDISFDLASGQTLALVGESGSGKTTTGKAIIQLLRESQGSIHFEGVDLSKINRKKLRRLRHDMQIIFQDPYASLNPRMMIFNCIAEGLIAQKKVRSKKEALDKVNAVLQTVELDPNIKWRYPHEFSGGQRQRICIARALVLNPTLLILDEPTSALDVSIQMQVLKLLEKLQKELRLSYLLITHNLSIVAYLAHSTAVMQAGKIVEQGPTRDILKSPTHHYTQQLIASIPRIRYAS